MRILFVCLGNICRSPTAEGVLRSIVREEGLEGEVVIDSAGTGGWHVGSPPDERATAAAARRSIVLEGAARQFSADDFDQFDLILAMDSENVRELLRIAPSEEAARKVRLFREFDASAAASGDLDVPDPYYGGARGFDDVLDMVEAASRGLVERLRKRQRG